MLLVIGVFLLLPNAALAASIPILDQFASGPVNTVSSFPTGSNFFTDGDFTLYANGGPFNLQAVSIVIASQAGTVNAAKIRFVQGTACYSDTFNPTAISPTIVNGGTTPSSGNTGVLNTNFSGTDCTININEGMNFEIVDAATLTPLGSFDNMFIPFGGTYGTPYVELFDSPFPPDNTLTRVVSVFPPDDPTFASPYATSTVFDISGDIYVNDDDYVNGMVFRQRVFNNSAAASLAAGPSFSEGGNLLCNAMPAWLCPRPDNYAPSVPNSITIEYDISSSGDSSYATTTDISVIGNYTMVSEIIRPNTSFFGLIPGADSIFVSTTTRFQVVEPSGYDIVVGDTVQAIQDLRENIAPTCSFDFTAGLSNYLPQIISCVAAISQVATAEIVLGIQNAVSDFLSHAPWGYGMLVYQAIQEDSNATTTLPVMAFDFSVVPGVDPVAIDLTPWNYMMCPDSEFASYETPDGENFLNDILLHWWNILCWVIWAIAVLVFVFKIEHDQDHDGDD